MTPADIARMLKYAHCPRSKTVECTFPNPRIILHVPVSYVPVLTEVAKQFALPGQRLEVVLLESKEVSEREHVYVKMKGYVPPFYHDWSDCHPEERARLRRTAQLTANRNVVIECASVIA